MLAAQRGEDRVGPGRDVMAAGALERGGYLGAGQLRRPGRVRCLGQQFQHVRGIRSPNASSAAGKYSRSWCRSRCTVRVRSQIIVLWARATTLMRLGFGAVAGDRAELMRVGAHHVRQHVGIAAVALGAGNRVPLPVPGSQQGLPRTPCTRRRSAPHPRAAVGLDADHDLRVTGVLGHVPADEIVQLAHAGRALGQPLLHQDLHRPRLITSTS